MRPLATPAGASSTAASGHCGREVLSIDEGKHLTATGSPVASPLLQWPASWAAANPRSVLQTGITMFSNATLGTILLLWVTAGHLAPPASVSMWTCVWMTSWVSSLLLVPLETTDNACFPEGQGADCSGLSGRGGWCAPGLWPPSSYQPLAGPQADTHLPVGCAFSAASGGCGEREQTGQG